MERFLLTAISFYCEGAKEQRLSKNVANAFNNMIVNEEIIKKTVYHIQHFVGDKLGGKNTRITSTDGVYAKHYFISVVNEDLSTTEIICLSFTKITETVHEEAQVKEILDKIWAE